MKVGEIIKVGEFSWPNVIGYTPDASHGNSSEKSSGSIDVGCAVKILLIDDKQVVAELIRQATPRGAQAWQGSILKLSRDTVALWKGKLDAAEIEKSENEMLVVKALAVRIALAGDGK